MVFVLRNEQGYQFLECNKNYKESDDSDVLMTILISMVMGMMMVVMLIIMVKPKQQGSTHYQKPTVNVQYFTHVHSHNPGISSRFPASSSMFSVELSLEGALCIRLVGRKGSLKTTLTVLSNNEGHYWGETAVQAECHNSSDMSMKALLASRP